MLVRYILSSICLRLSQFSQLSFMQLCGCVYSAYPFLLWWLWEYVYYLITILKLEVWPICHSLWLGHETMVCTVSFYILISIVWLWQMQHRMRLWTHNRHFIARPPGRAMTCLLWVFIGKCIIKKCNCMVWHISATVSTFCFIFVPL